MLNFLFIALGAYFYKSWFDPSAAFHITWNDAFLLASVLAGSDEVSAISLVKIQDFPRMGALIFGEGVINDALSIVLFRTFLRLYDREHSHGSNSSVGIDNLTTSCFNLFTSIMIQLIFSCVIGLSCGLLNARMMKQLTFIRRYPIHQTSLIMLFGYLSYSIAEAFNISGILTLFIAAVTLAHYSWYSLSRSSQIATRISFGAISDISEGFAFSYVGLSLWKYTGQFNFLFATYMLAVVIVSRIVTVYGLFFVLKFRFKSFDIPFAEQTGFIMGGIVRGCLCWAQILQVQGMAVLVSSTLIIVLSTTLGCGFLLPILMPLVNVGKIKVEQAVEDDQKPDDIILITATDSPYHRFSPNEQRQKESSSSMVLNRPSLYNVDRFEFDSETKQLQHAYPGESDIEKHNELEQSTRDSDAGMEIYSAANSSIFIKWIWFDERIMKPLFGGSAPDKLRSHILLETDSPNFKSTSPDEVRTNPQPLASAFTHHMAASRGALLVSYCRKTILLHCIIPIGEILSADFDISRDANDDSNDESGDFFSEQSSGDNSNLHATPFLNNFSTPCSALLGRRGMHSPMPFSNYGSDQGSTSLIYAKNNNKQPIYQQLPSSVGNPLQRSAQPSAAAPRCVSFAIDSDCMS